MKLLRQLFRDTERAGRMLSLLKSRRAQLWLILLAQGREQRPSRASHCTSVNARSGPRLISLLAMPITAGATSCNRKETHFLCSHSTGSRDFFRTTSRNNHSVQSIQTGQPCPRISSACMPAVLPTAVGHTPTAKACTLLPLAHAVQPCTNCG